MKNKILLLLILLFKQALFTYACGDYELTLKQITDYSSQITRAKVVDKSCFYNDARTFIYTKYSLEVITVFRGSNSQKIDIIEEGGMMNDLIVTSSASRNLEVGEEGYFFLSVNTNHQYTLATSSQSYFVINNNLQTASNGFLNYSIVDYNFEKQIEKMVGSIAIKIKTVDSKIHNQNKLAQGLPLVTNISPKTITAGTESILTISGSGFGNGSDGIVYFTNSDDGGATLVSAFKSNIQSWTDSKIVVKVPSQAGTGSICVSKAGSQSYSTQILTVTYARSSVATTNNINYESNLVNESQVGGYLISLNTKFEAKTEAKNSFLNALENWRCSSLVNFTLTSATTLDVKENDNVNVIRFASPSELKPGVLGITYNFFVSCADSYWYVKGFDMIFLDSLIWNFDTTQINSNTYDFLSVVTHELGHAHQLSHVIDKDNLMHFSIRKAESKRVIDANSLACAGLVLADATKSNICGPKPMQLLLSNICGDVFFTFYELQKPQLLPNPVNDILNINFFLPNDAIGTLQIFDIIGQLVVEPINGKMLQGKNSVEVSINNSNFSKGTYFVKLVTLNKTFVSKLVVGN